MVRPPYPVAVRLCWIAALRWDQIESHYHATTIPLLRLTPAAFAGRIYSWAIERVEHDKLDEWEQDMIDLLPWQDSTSAAAEDIESASFYANYSGE